MTDRNVGFSKMDSEFQVWKDQVLQLFAETARFAEGHPELLQAVRHAEAVVRSELKSPHEQYLANQQQLARMAENSMKSLFARRGRLRARKRARTD